MTVGELAAWWLSEYAPTQHVEPSSLVRYKYYLTKQILPKFATTKVADINRRVVAHWVTNDLARQLAPKTCNDTLAFFKKLFNDARRDEVVAENPIGLVRRVPLQRAEDQHWTEAQARTFLTTVKREAPKLHDVFSFALQTGMRLGEIAALKCDVVDVSQRERGMVWVKRTWCQKTRVIKEYTKTKQARVVPLNQDLQAILLAMQAHGSADTIWPANIDFKNLVRNLRSLAKKAGVPIITFHALRHTFASMWMASGKPQFGVGYEATFFRRVRSPKPSTRCSTEMSSSSSSQ